MDLQGTPYLLEPMTARHVPTVAQIERRVFTQPWSYANFSHEVTNNPYSEYLVLRYGPWAEAGGEASGRPGLHNLLRGRPEDRSILGYGGFWLMLDEAHIATLALRADWRGRGLGELLLAALIERAYAREAAFATLEVRRTNTVAQRLYEKYGFAYSGVRVGYYLDNREDALIMTTPPIRSEGYRRRYGDLVERLQRRLLEAATSPPAASERSTL